MGLFSRKKKEQTQENLPPLKFPELPSTPHTDAQRPMQPDMREAAAIKQAVSPQTRPMPARPEPMSQPMPEPMHAEPMQEHPLFIQVDNYNELLDTISTIKAKLTDASHVLEELTKLKQEEDSELTAWHNDLNAIKEKLMMVDQKLSQ